MMKNSFVLVVNSGVIILLTIAAFWQLYWVGTWRAVFFIAVSGAGAAAGKRLGVEDSPEKNWNRERTKVHSILSYMLLFALISIPAAIVAVFVGIYAGSFVGVASAISSLWLTCFAVALTSKLMERWIGPAKVRRDASKTIATPKPTTT